MTNKLKHLILRGSIWTYQRQVPRFISHLFPQRLLTKSLKTSDIKVACQRRDELNKKIEQMLSISPFDNYQSTLTHLDDTLTDNDIAGGLDELENHVEANDGDMKAGLREMGMPEHEYYALKTLSGMRDEFLPQRYSSGGIHQLLKLYIKTRSDMSTDTIARMKYEVQRFLEFKDEQDTDILNVSRSDVSKFLDSQGTDVAISSKKKTIRRLGQLWSFARDRSSSQQIQDRARG